MLSVYWTLLTDLCVGGRGARVRRHVGPRDLGNRGRHEVDVWRVTADHVGCCGKHALSIVIVVIRVLSVVDAGGAAD